MKNEAERSGADVAPISLTGGIDSGRGVVSTRACWLNLGGRFGLAGSRVRGKGRGLERIGALAGVTENQFGGEGLARGGREGSLGLAGRHLDEVLAWAVVEMLAAGGKKFGEVGAR